MQYRVNWPRTTIQVFKTKRETMMLPGHDICIETACQTDVKIFWNTLQHASFKKYSQTYFLLRLEPRD